MITGTPIGLFSTAAAVALMFPLHVMAVPFSDDPDLVRALTLSFEETPETFTWEFRVDERIDGDGKPESKYWEATSSIVTGRTGMGGPTPGRCLIEDDMGFNCLPMPDPDTGRGQDPCIGLDEMVKITATHLVDPHTRTPDPGGIYVACFSVSLLNQLGDPEVFQDLGTDLLDHDDSVGRHDDVYELTARIANIPHENFPNSDITREVVEFRLTGRHVAEPPAAATFGAGLLVLGALLGRRRALVGVARS